MDKKLTSGSLSPFSYISSPNFAEILRKLGCSLVLTSNQSGKVLFLSPMEEQKLVLLPRTFQRPLGLCANGDQMAIATKSQIDFLVNNRELARSYPPKVNTYDALFLPQKTIYTGHIDLHDLHFGANGELFGVNTLFSCLVTFSDNYSFVPIWKPGFISDLVPEDRCHLNGIAMQDGRPKYVTALGAGNSARSWSQNITSGGILMDVDSDEIIVEGLALPHSPRIYGEGLFLLQSAGQNLVKVDVQSGKITEIVRLPGFVRGMARCKNILFIGISKSRKNASSFGNIDIDKRDDKCGLYAVDLTTGSIVGQLEWLNSVEEVYDIEVLPNILRPNILNTLKEDHSMGVSMPGKTFWAKRTDENS